MNWTLRNQRYEHKNYFHPSVFHSLNFYRHETALKVLLRSFVQNKFKTTLIHLKSISEKVS